MTDLDAVKVALEKAHTEVGEVCRRTGPGRWRMSIPAQPNRDSDLIISDALRHADDLLAEVSRLTADLPTGELYDRIRDAIVTDADVDSPESATSAAYGVVLPVLASLDIQVRHLTEDRDRLTDGIHTALDALRKGQHNLGREALTDLLQGGAE